MSLKWKVIVRNGGFCGRKCSTKKKGQPGLSWQGELRGRDRKRESERETRDGKEMLSALSNNALTTRVLPR